MWRQSANDAKLIFYFYPDSATYGWQQNLIKILTRCSKLYKNTRMEEKKQIAFFEKLSRSKTFALWSTVSQKIK